MGGDRWVVMDGWSWVGGEVWVAMGFGEKKTLYVSA